MVDPLGRDEAEPEIAEVVVVGGRDRKLESGHQVPGLVTPSPLAKAEASLRWWHAGPRLPRDRCRTRAAMQCTPDAAASRARRRSDCHGAAPPQAAASPAEYRRYR